MERRIQPRKKSLRRELECYVIGWNTILKGVVQSMDVVTLLRNAHPSYRPSFATQCEEAGMLTNREASEFKIGPTSRR
jgi:hypothetical protein